VGLPFIFSKQFTKNQVPLPVFILYMMSGISNIWDDRHSSLTYSKARVFAAQPKTPIRCGLGDELRPMILLST